LQQQQAQLQLQQQQQVRSHQPIYVHNSVSGGRSTAGSWRVCIGAVARL
jgi:hypothetical protein